jgi:anaerobic magnesium-protoporphyrin IX monomethyl ester cyclase
LEGPDPSVWGAHVAGGLSEAGICEMKILLINPPRNRAQAKTYGYTFSPALACISAMLKAQGYRPRILDLFDNHNWNTIESLLRQQAPDVVGITCLTNTRMSVFRLAAMAKAINPDTAVIVGGPHPTVMYEQMLGSKAVDIVAIGEGDLTAIALVRALEHGDPPARVEGIAFREGERVISTQPRPLIKDLDSLPRPDYYHLDQPADGKPQRTGVSIGRGCRYNCQFCASSSVWGNTYRAKSVTTVVDEIEFILGKSGENVIFVGDDMIGVTELETVRFCEEILKRGLDFRWYANARVDSLSERILRLMKRAGCVMICYGVESGSPEILKTINKRITVEQIVAAFRLTHEIGIECQATVMVGNPGENGDTVRETESLLNTIRPDYLWVSFTTIYPGTALYQLAMQEGLIDETYWLTDLVAPIYRGSMSLPRMFYYKWRMNLKQVKRRGGVARFARSFLAEISPHRVHQGLRLTWHHLLKKQG